MKRRNYELSSNSKAYMKKQYFKLAHHERMKWLDDYPTMFSSSDTLMPLTFPSPLLRFFGGVTTFSGAGSIPSGINAFSNLLAWPLTIPYIVSFSNAIQIGGDTAAGIGVGVTASNYSGVAAATYNAGAGWGDTIMFSNSVSGVCSLNITNNNVSVQNGTFGTGSSILLNTTNVITIQEYIPGQIYAAVTNTNATTFFAPWTKIGVPWQTLSETRGLVFAAAGNGSPCTYGASIVQTPPALIGFNNQG